MLATAGHASSALSACDSTQRPGARARVSRATGLLLLCAAGVGCSTSTIIGPLSREQDERQHLMDRAKSEGVPNEFIDKVAPPLTREEKLRASDQDSSCKTTYRWKNLFTYTGSGFVAGAAGLTIGGAYATGNTDTTKAVFGVTGGTMALFGTALVALGGILQNHYTDHGCTVRLDQDP